MNKIPIDWQSVAKWSAALAELNIADSAVRVSMEGAHAAYPEWEGIKGWMVAHKASKVHLSAARKAYEEAVRA